MRNKILIVEKDREDKEQLELILQEIAEEGGELFFAETEEEGLAILKKERPHLVFLKSALINNEKEWRQERVHVVFLCLKAEKEKYKGECMTKPLRPHQVLEICRSVLGKDNASPIPPM